MRGKFMMMKVLESFFLVCSLSSCLSKGAPKVTNSLVVIIISTQLGDRSK